MQVQDILARKGHQVYSVPPDCSVGEAAEMIGSRNIGVAVIVNSQGALLGIISERDFVRSIRKIRGNLSKLPVTVLMTSRVVTCTPETSARDALSLMGKHRVRHLPVVRDGQILGLISVRDVLKFQLEVREQQDRNDRRALFHADPDGYSSPAATP